MCENYFFINQFSNPKHPNFGNPIKKHRKKIVCSKKCHDLWQKSISWEKRIGEERAEEIRKIRHISFSENNPNKIPGVSEKISISLKKYISEHPESRVGQNNPFFGKQHSEKQKEIWRNNKKGQKSYSREQEEKQKKNTPKKENHHAWKGGTSNGEYGIEFNSELKQIIKEKYHHQCQLCGSVNSILDIHHIDYEKTNNDIQNLIPLCKVCHGKTNYNRSKWIKILNEIKK